ncbi:hypothetical protein GCM10009775_06250 [Microbacterium aoyamense]|uniref:Uncharacterized protein n=1 Tax=Microbacterium aoyamense TaxID=344166 RepID=A0ABP5ANL0_9MICO|nr:hypothetical protein [Microbacterium aoyamense]
MSTTGNANEGVDHHGQDGGSDALTAGEAQREMAGQAEQDRPAMSQNNASDMDKIAGVVAQTRVDVGGKDHESIVHVLRQRLEQAGVPLTGTDVDELARQVRGA